MNEIIEAAEPQRAIVAQDNTPSAMLMLAVSRGDDMERIKQLMDLQDRFEAGQSLKAYNEDFAAFKAEAVPLVKNKQVKDGPLKGKGYAELHAVVNAITPALSRHNLSASWKLTKDERDWIEVTCYLKHSKGHSESVSMGGPPDAGGAKNAIQARASTVSYLERYTLKAIVGLAEQGVDDDGNGGGIERKPIPKAEDATPREIPRSVVLQNAANAAIEKFAAGDEMGAYEELCWVDDSDEKVALWGLLKKHSALRAAIKRIDAEVRAKEQQLKKDTK